MKLAGKIIFLSLAIFCFFLFKKRVKSNEIYKWTFKEEKDEKFADKEFYLKDTISANKHLTDPAYPFEGISYAVFQHYKRIKEENN